MAATLEAEAKQLPKGQAFTDVLDPARILKPGAFKRGARFRTGPQVIPSLGRGCSLRNSSNLSFVARQLGWERVILNGRYKRLNSGSRDC